MELIALGLNYKRYSVGERELFHIPPSHRESFLKGLLERGGVLGAVYLPTCNRVEIYAALVDGFDWSGLVSFWRDFAGVGGDVAAVPYTYRDEEAFGHLVKVACGLDSMLLGETPILGQVREAYFQALNWNTTGPLLNFAFQQAIRYAKRIRTKTGIGKFPVSVSSVAIRLLEQIFGDFKDRTALVIGLGEMGRETAGLLKKRRISRLLVTNRTQARAVCFAKDLGASVIPFHFLGETISKVDMVITSTSSDHLLVTKEMLLCGDCLEKEGPVVFVDLSVPRDVAPDIQELQNVYLYNVDDLKTIAEKNRAYREEEALVAKAMIQKSVETFRAEWKKRILKINLGRVAHLARVLP